MEIHHSCVCVGVCVCVFCLFVTSSLWTLNITVIMLCCVSQSLVCGPGDWYHHLSEKFWSWIRSVILQQRAASVCGSVLLSQGSCCNHLMTTVLFFSAPHHNILCAVVLTGVHTLWSTYSLPKAAGPMYYSNTGTGPDTVSILYQYCITATICAPVHCTYCPTAVQCLHWCERSAHFLVRWLR